MKYSQERNIKTLELHRVLESLAEETSIPDAAEKALNLTPVFDISKVKTLLAETDDAYKLIAKYTSPPFGKITNILSALSHAEIGAVLSMSDLLRISHVLRVIRSVKKWRNDSDSFSETSIDYLFSSLVPNKFLEDKINSAIKSEDEMNDNASPMLADIRRKIKNNSAKIRDILEKTVRGQAAKYLQDAIITQRDGRFVVPVKSEHKSEIKGIVHDTSATGSTVFIEPMAVVEANNEIRILQSKESEEIEKILSELTSAVADFSGAVRASYNALVSLDLIFAKAKLAYKMGAVVPVINDTGYIYLKNARHPLINRTKVVPITVYLGKDFNQLIITGPNTGGKTVSLKTVGLLSLMTACGLMIPVDDTSEMSVFSGVYVDIGDEQSIEQSLSTFSSHMVNIISILNECDGNSLVLFDELCAGTDPIEGAALAKAILMKLDEIGAKVIATTHYPELKSYAIEKEGVLNASCEFDVNTLKPTYRLILGVPGRSNAFAISSRLGLDEAVILSAKSQLTDENMKFENVVAALEKARQDAEEEHKRAEKLRLEAEGAKKRTSAIEAEFKNKQSKLMEETRAKAKAIIETARERASALLNELEETKKGFNRENAAEMLERARSGLKSTMRELEDSADPIIKNSGGPKLKNPPKKGDIVSVSSLSREAQVLEIDSDKKKVLVLSGVMRILVDFEDLRESNKNHSDPSKKPKIRNNVRKVSGIPSKLNQTVSGEIDLRGMASDEALIELDKYIDNALISGINTVTIIHGKGTGVLRKSVQSHLKNHKNIKSFRLGVFGEGESGVTIAEIGD